MKKICVFADIHGNAAAFQTVLEHAGKCDLWWCAGDTVGYGPDPNKCIEMVGSLGSVVIAGNHDLGSLGRISISTFNNDARKACEWTSGVLRDENKAFLKGLETTKTPLEEVLLSHGGPIDPVWSYIFSLEEACLNFMGFDQEICFHGHSHVPMIFSFKKEDNKKVKPADLAYITPRDGDVIVFEEGSRYLVNVGSVGQPRDNDPRSCYVIFEPEERKVTYHRVEYPIAETQEKMAFVGLPGSLIERLALGR